MLDKQYFTRGRRPYSFGHELGECLDVIDVVNRRERDQMKKTDSKNTDLKKYHKKVAADFRRDIGKDNYVKYGEPRYIEVIEAYSYIDPGFAEKWLPYVTNYVLFVYENHEKNSRDPASNLGVYLCNVLTVKSKEEQDVLDNMKKVQCREFSPNTALFKQWFELRGDLDKAKAVLCVNGVFYWGRRLAANKPTSVDAVIMKRARLFIEYQKNACKPAGFDGHMHHPILMKHIVNQFMRKYDITTEYMFELNEERFCQFHQEKLQKAPLVPMSDEGHRNFHKLQDQLLKIFNRAPEEDDYVLVYKFLCEGMDTMTESYDFDVSGTIELWKEFLNEKAVV